MKLSSFIWEKVIKTIFNKHKKLPQTKKFLKVGSPKSFKHMGHHRQLTKQYGLSSTSHSLGARQQGFKSKLHGFRFWQKLYTKTIEAVPSKSLFSISLQVSLYFALYLKI